MFNSEILKKSFENEISLLKDIIENPNKYNNGHYRNILRWKINFAKFEDQNLNIISLSINTHVNKANKLINGGYLELNNYRLNAKRSIENIKKNNNSRKNEQTVIYNLQVKNLQLSELVIILMSKLHDYAYKSGNSELIEDFKIKNKEIEILLGYTQGDPHE